MLYTSVTLLAELAEVIARDKFAHRVHLAGLSAADLVQDYRNLAYLVEPQSPPAPISRDPDDDHVRARRARRAHRRRRSRSAHAQGLSGYPDRQRSQGATQSRGAEVVASKTKIGNHTLPTAPSFPASFSRTVSRK